jgi:hypothetical protein
MIYFDTVSYHAPAVECAIKTVGADRLIFGTDSPMMIALKKRGRDLIDQVELNPADKSQGAWRHGQDAAETLGGTIMKAAVVGENGAEVRAVAEARARTERDPDQGARLKPQSRRCRRGGGPAAWPGRRHRGPPRA